MKLPNVLLCVLIVAFLLKLCYLLLTNPSEAVLYAEGWAVGALFVFLLSVKYIIWEEEESHENREAQKV